MVNVAPLSPGVPPENRNPRSVMVLLGGLFLFRADAIMTSSPLSVTRPNPQLFVPISPMPSPVANKLLCNVLVIWCVPLAREVETTATFGTLVVGVGAVVSVVGRRPSMF